MKINMGRIDRIIRVLLAIVMAFLALTGIVSGTAGIILLAIAGIFILTSVIGLCPLYSLFGINTCVRNKSV